MLTSLVEGASHAPWIVVLSVVVSVVAAYAATDLFKRARGVHGRAWLAWLAGSATVDGIGTWSMHYTGKLALRLPVPMLFDRRLVVLSLLVSIIGSAMAFVVIGHGRLGWPRMLAAGVCLGAIGISGLHYTAMAAMRLPGMDHRYDSPALVALSVVLAVVISTAAIRMTFGAPDGVPAHGLRAKHVGPITRGAASPVMHYTAMAAVVFASARTHHDFSHAVRIESLGVLGISVVPVMVLVVALLTSLADRLRTERALLNELFDQGPQAVALINAEDRIVRANREFTRLFGYAQHELVGRSTQDLIVPDDLREEARRLADQAAHGERVDVETVRQRKDGSRVPVSMMRVPVSLPGGQRETYAIFRDETERLELEAQLRQAQKMEAVGRLAGGVAHDFNNLLMVIHSNAAFAAAELPGDAAAQTDLTEVLKAADRAAELTRQLLAFGRQQVLQPSQVDVNRQVANVAQMLRRVIGEDISLDVSLEPEVGPVHADPGQLEQVLMNLAMNARDAMPNGGTLRLRTANELVDAAMARTRPGLEPGVHVALVVEDTGTGIDPEVLPHLFEPFVTTKGPGKGTGLGLATVYGIVEQSGGHVYAESTPGRGSRFTVLLPWSVEPDGSATNAPATSVPQRGTETILLVEDEAGVRAAIRRMLTRQGYTVLDAASGPEALQLVESSAVRIDLVLTDVVMPGQSGRSLVEHLTARWPGLRVLYMSGYTDDEMLRRGLMQSGTALLEKPFTPDRLADVVRQALGTPSPPRG